jgi:hypothetical protein
MWDKWEAFIILSSHIHYSSGPNGKPASFYLETLSSYVNILKIGKVKSFETFLL